MPHIRGTIDTVCQLLADLQGYTQMGTDWIDDAMCQRIDRARIDLEQASRDIVAAGIERWIDG